MLTRWDYQIAEVTDRLNQISATFDIPGANGAGQTLNLEMQKRQLEYSLNLVLKRISEIPVPVAPRDARTDALLRNSQTFAQKTLALLGRYNKTSRTAIWLQLIKTRVFGADDGQAGISETDLIHIAGRLKRLNDVEITLKLDLERTLLRQKDLQEQYLSLNQTLSRIQPPSASSATLPTDHTDSTPQAPGIPRYLGSPHRTVPREAGGGLFSYWKEMLQSAWRGAPRDREILSTDRFQKAVDEMNDAYQGGRNRDTPIQLTGYAASVHSDPIADKPAHL